MAHFQDWKRVKVYQLMRRRGDALTYHRPGESHANFRVAVRLDGIDFDERGNNYMRTP